MPKSAGGKPKIITKKLPTKKRAEDYARRRGGSKPIKDNNPKKGNTHFHPTDKKGNKKTGKNNIHVEPNQKRGRLPD